MTASAGFENDAQSGADAGDLRATATPVPTFKQFKGAAPLGDVDWYAASIPAGPVCVLSNVSANREIFVDVGVESAGETLWGLTRATSAGVLGGFAVPTTSVATLAVKPVAEDVTNYRANITTVGFAPLSAVDMGTGTDAGDIVGEATPASAGCITGYVGVPLDTRDVYSIEIPAGGAITYSFVGENNALSLSLLDEAGNAIAPILGSGDAATFTSAQGGTFFLSASPTASVGSTSYLIGLVVGTDPPPGHGCRPTC